MRLRLRLRILNLNLNLNLNLFEQDLAAFTGAARAVATVNGTCALQTALKLVGVESTDEIITQPLTFVA